MEQTMAETDPEVDCPYCPKSWSTTSERGNQNPRANAAQHIYHSSDHPDVSPGRARELVDEHNFGDGDGDGGGAEAPVAPEDMMDHNPIFRTPAIPDGGTPRCPDCRARMEQLEEGTEIKGHVDGEEVRAKADGSDHWCSNCEIAVVSQGDVIR